MLESNAAKISDLIGKTFRRVTCVMSGEPYTRDYRHSEGSDEMVFVAENGERYRFYHRQDCCESVTIDDVIGNLSDLCGSPILMAEESSNHDDSLWPKGENRHRDYSHLWTFYRFATVKGYVTVRWYGSSNGYYGESVDFERIPPKEDR